MRADMVCEQTLAAAANRIGLGQHLLLGHGEEQGGGRTRSSILADAMESVIAASFLDGGMEAALQIVRTFIFVEVPVTKLHNADYKTQLQEMVQQKKNQILSYELVGQMKKAASEFIPGEDLDLVVGLDESIGEEKKDEEKKEKAKDKILAILKEKYNIEEKDFLSAELEVVPSGKTKYLGLDKSMVLGYGQDDRICSFTSLEALLEAETMDRTSVCILVDKEEIGSVGATGMDSLFFENATAEVLAKMGLTSSLSLRRTLKNTMMLSSDVNSAYDPLNASLYDKKNSSFLGGGVVFNKYTGSRGKSGASDANPEFIGKIRGVLEKNGVKYQMAEMAKVDVGGGGTIAKFSAYYGMQVIDCGVAILSMHAPWEIASCKDIINTKNAYKAFLTLE